MMYNLAFAIDELALVSFLKGIIINASLIILLFIFMEGYKSYHFSGFLLINRKGRQSLSHLKRVCCFWVVGKLIDIVLCSVLLSTGTVSVGRLVEFTQGSRLKGFALYFVYIIELLLTEVWPGKVALHQSFLTIFKPVGMIEDNSEEFIDEEDTFENTDNEERNSISVLGTNDSSKSLKRPPSHKTSNPIDRKFKPESLVIPNVFFDNILVAFFLQV